MVCRKHSGVKLSQSELIERTLEKVTRKLMYIYNKISTSKITLLALYSRSTQATNIAICSLG